MIFMSYNIIPLPLSVNKNKIIFDLVTIKNLENSYTRRIEVLFIKLIRI